MEKIKIISNPYKQEIKYEEWDKLSETWIPIIFEENQYSKLVSNDFTKGFFPFKLNRIIDRIIEDYFVGEPINVFFEGTADEYDELGEFCQSEEYREKVILHKAEKYLENAREILPDIRDIYKNSISPLVEASFKNIKKVSKKVEKFSDASSDIIPICVLGNYSAGKSTFINALIGHEILPSAERPTTAKIYKIMEEELPNQASISWKYDEDKVVLCITENDYHINSLDNALADKICETLGEEEGKDIFLKLKVVLALINDFERDSEINHIDDLIEIKVPFSSSIWTDVLNKFVVFDTPGSNSASNEKHLLVLKKAMEGLTNGIPVFVTKFDQLDTTDNEKLYEEINNMKELDTRFTMIIVNKADAASLPKEGFDIRDKQDILRQAIPKKMYSCGIFFLSSVMGLGSKNEGKFFDEHSAEIFEDQRNKYSDPESKFYKELYQYNIMPDQLKKKTIENALECEKLIFANSGLFSVEEEIREFATKYAAYNKCEQSKLFLSQIIDITMNEIEDAKARKEKHKQQIEEELDIDKNNLINRIEEYGKKCKACYIDEYPAQLQPIVTDRKIKRTEDQIKNWNKDCLYIAKHDMGFEKELQDVKDAVSAIGTELKNNVNSFASHVNMSSLNKIGRGIKETVKETANEFGEWNSVRINAEKEAMENLLLSIEKDFDNHLKESKMCIEAVSKDYWEKATKQIKIELISLITDSAELSAEKKKELSDIVIEYQDIQFKKQYDQRFDKSRFQKKFILFKEAGELNHRKIAKTYNSGMIEEVDFMYGQLSDDHKSCFKSWLDKLINTVTDNIVDFSPKLHKAALIIEEEIERIEELEFRQNLLNEHNRAIKTMMEWKN